MPTTIIWERWRGGRERVELHYRPGYFPPLCCRIEKPAYAVGWESTIDRFYNLNLAQRPKDRIYESFQGNTYYQYGDLESAWLGDLGEFSAAHMQLDVTEKNIRLYAIGGKFGAIVNRVREYGDAMRLPDDIVPKPEWILFEVPISEKALQPFLDGKRSYARLYENLEYGRSPKVYRHEDKQRGITWSLIWYFDFRPLVGGRIEAVGERGVVFGIGGNFSPRIRQISYRLKPGESFCPGAEAYAVFNEDGTIDRLYDPSEI